MNDKALFPYLNRKIYIDVLKVIAILLVITRHLIGTTACGGKGIVQEIAIIFDSFTVIAVPIFIMCSGYVNLSKEYDIKHFLKKRMSKIVIPFFLWSIFYYIWGHKINFIQDKYSAKTFLVNFIGNNQMYGFLWFCYTIIGLYLITPILRALLENMSKETYKYLLILWFLFNGVIGLVNTVFKLNVGFYIEVGLFSGYYLLGYYLERYGINKKLQIVFCITSIISFIVIVLGFRKYTDYLFDNKSVLTIFISISVFMLFKNVKWINIFTKVKALPTVIYNISTCTYGIYLSHYFFRDIVFNKIKFYFTQKNIIPMTFVIVLGILAVSFTITKIYGTVKNLLLKYIFKPKLKPKQLNKPIEALQ